MIKKIDDCRKIFFSDEKTGKKVSIDFEWRRKHKIQGSFLNGKFWF